ncbi:MAG: response regulator, partial [Proteobacteria bacterium]|nr:response regulator [Pseudomonadota bacterium]
FENKALGMSMEYGLRASLLNISETFERLLREREIEGERIYPRIVFIDADGKLLVDTRTGTKGKEDDRDWKGLLSPKGPGATISVEYRRRLEVVASIPYFFKGEYTGQIVAWISPKTIYYLAKRGKGTSGRFVYIACEKHQILAPPDTPLKDSFSTLPELGSLKAGEIHHIKTLKKDGSKVEMIALRVPVKGAPLSVVALLPASELEGRIALWYLPLGMGILAILILCGTAVAYRINTQRLVLNTRLDEASKVREEIEKKVERRTAELTQAIKQLGQEIEDRKEAEAELKASEKRTRRLIEASPVGICIHQRGMYVYANPAFVKTFGYEHPDEIVGSPVESLFDPEDRALITKRGKKRLEGKEVPLSYNVRGLKKEGKSFAASLWGTVIDYQNASAILGFVVDMSAERELRSQLRHAQKMEAVSTLAGGIAHDFNNILTAILGYGQLAQMKLDPESKVYGDLKEVLQSANRAKSLIQQILAVGRSQEQKRRPMQLKHIVREALKFLRSTLPSTIEIQEKWDQDIGIIDADPTQMHQVLMNLCTNAGHAMEKNGGILEVSLRNVAVVSGNLESGVHLEPGPYLRLTVSDTGYGIAPEIKEKIFDPYFTTKEQGVGTGIGLSVVHGIVAQHKGAITVESEPGKGSTFHVYLPLTQAGEEQPEVKGETPLPKGNERILFIDDEAVLANMGKQILESLGYDVTSMTSSLDALALFKEDPEQFDLVITDTTMPHMPGDILAQKIMEIRPDIPVIICTGHSKRISKEKAKEMGIKGFLMKPPAMRDVADMVRKLLDEK